MVDEWALGIDVGTSRSAGAMANGSVSPLEVEGNRWMPSMVLLDQSGTLVVGSAADYQAGVYPDRLERTPKRYLGGAAPLLLGDTAVEVEDAIARLIRVFVAEGQLRHGGRAPTATVLTHPVRWGEDRKAALVDAAGRAGLRDPRLIEEPVAAAVHYVGDRVAVGEHVGVYDLGGGTFDTAVLRRTEAGFESVGAPGGDEFIGGEHFDHLVYEYLGACLADLDAELWEQVQYGEDRRWTRAAADLLTQARRAKEAVSSYPTTQVLLPLVDRDVVFTRDQFEAMIRPLVEATVTEMATTIESAGLAPEDLRALYLVGGSSRIPLVTELMTARFGDRIATRDEPKSVVALGAAAVARRGPLDLAGGPVPAAAGPQPGGAAAPPAAPRPGAPSAATARVRRVWGLDLGAAIHGLAAVGPDISVTLADGTLHRLEAQGSWRWSVPLAGVAYGAPVPGAGTLHVGCSTSAVVALDTRTGRQRWRAAVQAAVVPPPALVADVVVAADDTGTVAAFAARDGSLRWLLPLGTNVRAPLAAGASSLLVAGVDGRVFRVDAATGQVAWAFPVPAPVGVAPLVVGDVAVLASSEGMVYGVDPATGHARWGCRLGGPVDGALAAWGGLVLVADRSGRLSALDVAAGSVHWQVETSGPNPTGVAVERSVAVLDNGADEIVAVGLDARAVLGRLPVTSGAWQHPVVTGDLVLVPSGRALVAVRVTA